MIRVCARRYGRRSGKGYDIQLGREVAIKALRSDVTNAEAKLRRLRAEAHNSANLAHPNIAALFEYYEHDGIGFLIMEYVPLEIVGGPVP